MTPSASQLRLAGAELGQYFEPYLRAITEWQDVVEWQFSLHPVSQPDCDQLTRQLVAPLLTLPGSNAIGAGLVLAAGTFAGEPAHFSWWTVGGGSETAGSDDRQSPLLQPLQIDEDPGSDQFHDFTRLEWWCVPRDTGGLHITGPYVDYICSSEYALTLSVPLTVSGAFAGIVGLDLLAGALGDRLQAALQHLGERALLINSTGRVLASTLAGCGMGDLIPRSARHRLEDPAVTSVTLGSRSFRVVPCQGVPYTLLAG